MKSILNNYFVFARNVGALTVMRCIFW